MASRLAGFIWNQLARARERRGWRKEFRYLGVRAVREQERHSVGSQEKLQYMRRWLKRQERLPYIVGAAIGGVSSIAGTIVGALLTAFLAAPGSQDALAGFLAVTPFDTPTTILFSFWP
jgi:hypothetical protein